MLAGDELGYYHRTMVEPRLTRCDFRSRLAVAAVLPVAVSCERGQVVRARDPMARETSSHLTGDAPIVSCHHVADGNKALRVARTLVIAVEHES
jgi:hypothetical protein